MFIRHKLALSSIALLFFALPAWAGGWSEGLHMPTARAYAGAAILGDNLYVIGGGGTSGPRSMTEIYDSTHKTWTLAAGLPAGLQQFGIAAFGGKIFIAGGFKAGNAKEGTPEGETAEVWVYDPAIGVWMPRASMPAARSSFGLVAIGEKLYAIGGSGKDTGRVFVYDIATDVWTTAKSRMPSPRMAAAYAGYDNRIYAIGGAQGTAATARVDVYDVDKDTWSSASPLPAARQSMAVAVIGDTIHVVGGQSIEPPKTFADHFVLNLKTGSWSKAASMRTARHAAVAASISGNFYVIGGSPGAGVYTVFTQSDVMEIFTPSK